MNDEKNGSEVEAGLEQLVAHAKQRLADAMMAEIRDTGQVPAVQLYVNFQLLTHQFNALLSMAFDSQESVAEYHRRVISNCNAHHQNLTKPRIQVARGMPHN